MTKYKVLIFPTAKQDLHEIIDYINEQSYFESTKLYDEIVERVASLAEFPFRYPLLKNPVLSGNMNFYCSKAKMEAIFFL
ncbi:hypothetical protein CIL05_19485 [Virgibacillus profundi]|uniref:Plasmid stabilization protein n=1 Tax=Virgibacillus profundi TaxID=2024555 RepID=A0A2A2I970_9BACI|nr:type II toxin-antitoxin system RelE/ParE family toxin [Virgibacillus profundi]PAV27866.1 hypothetical protein CIL05_19485 [Virgibacillus profundi]PXY52044.1 type II toxin-antitoxin system RelE/ParE family toxin [Virgibacillus profundi]